MKEEKYTCDICHEEHDVSELTYFDESYLCEDCLRRETFICRDCGDRHWNDDSADGDLCQTCYDEDYVRCERCDAVIHYDDACYHEDEEYHDHPYCRNCFDMDEIIHDYYYKPEPIFYGDGPRYLGVELELDDGGENEFCASKLLDIANAQKVEHWARRYGGGIINPKETLKHAKNSHMGRYAAVNLENDATIEMRIFRGTLKYSTFIATLQMVDEICKVAISLSDEFMQSLTWLDFVKGIADDKQELINYLKEKRLYVNEPIRNEVEI